MSFCDSVQLILHARFFSCLLSLQKRRERGRISIRGIRVVEAATIDGEGGDTFAPEVSFFCTQRKDHEKHDENFVNAFQGFPFQVGYCETNGLTTGTSTLPQYTLYLVAKSDKDRCDWIRVVRQSEYTSHCTL
jgi:tyrosine-protein kinase Tec